MNKEGPIPTEGELLGRIVEYIIDESFGVIYLIPILDIVTLFNWSEEAEGDILRFVDSLREKYKGEAKNERK